MTGDAKNRLIAAISTIIEGEGFSKLGVNHIAQVAQCDKVLIYRYFGGLDGLLTDWAQENDFYALVYSRFEREIEDSTNRDLNALVKLILTSQLDFLRSNKMMQELLLWELSGHSSFKAIQNQREERGNKLQQLLEHRLENHHINISLYITILISAINYIVLFTRQYSTINGMDFSQQQSWDLLKGAIDKYVDSLFDSIIPTLSK